jgi:hypothetical protein
MTGAKGMVRQEILPSLWANGFAYYPTIEF